MTMVLWDGQRSFMLAFFMWLICTVEYAIAGWVDPDTPVLFHATESLSGSEDTRPYQLVRCDKLCAHVCLTLIQIFSDEFEQSGRHFHDGTDPRWTAINKNDCTNVKTRQDIQPSHDVVLSIPQTQTWRCIFTVQTT